MAVNDKNCKYSKTEDKGLSFLCLIHRFQLTAVLRKTALLCSLLATRGDEAARAAGITSSWLLYFYFLNNHITDSESEISPPNVCTEIKSWCNSRTVPRAFTEGGNAC